MYVFLLETGIYISSQARVRVTLRPFARHQKIKYNSRTIVHCPKCRKKIEYFPKHFSDAFTFGRVLLFANSQPKVDLPFQIILGKKNKRTAFPFVAHIQQAQIKATLRLSFCRQFASSCWLDTAL